MIYVFYGNATFANNWGYEISALSSLFAGMAKAAELWEKLKDSE